MSDKNSSRSKQKKELWKLAFAKTSIHQAKKACEFIISNARQLNPEVYDTLAAGIFVLYARPFGENREVGKLPKKFGMYADSKLQNLHDMILMARDHFVAHTDADCPVCDERGKEKEKLLKLELILNFTGEDGMADVTAQIIAPRLTFETITLIKLLCEESIRRISAAEASLIKLLYEGRPMRNGRNLVNIFDET